LDSRCGLGAGAAGGSGCVERSFVVEVGADGVGVGFGSALGDLAGGPGGCEAGGGGVGLEFGVSADGALREVAAGDRGGGEEPDGVSDGWGSDEDAEGGAELPGVAVGVAERLGAVAEGEDWSEWAGRAVALTGVACAGGAVAAGSRATSRRARTVGRETGSTTRGIRGSDSPPESLARVSGAKLVAVGEAVEARTGAEFRRVQSSARPPRASATREITKSLRLWPNR